MAMDHTNRRNRRISANGSEENKKQDIRENKPESIGHER